MKDCKGKTIVRGSFIKCINDVDYGRVYQVVNHLHCLCIKDDEDSEYLPLKGFASENGRLIDFEVVSK